MRYVGLTFNTLHQYFGKIAVPEGFKEFNEVIGLSCSPRNWQRNRGFYYQEQRMKFLTRIEQEAKELEINGFLDNSGGTNKIDSTSSNTQQE